jgi:cytochrome c551/c552
MHSKKMLAIGLLSLLAVILAACAGAPGEPGPIGPAGPAGLQGPAGPAPMATDLSCTECHNDSTLITGKHTAWSESLHGTGGAYLRGTSSSCAGCHSGGGFSARIAAGLNPDEVEAGDPNPTRQDCRACHQIHTTFTGADWALETTDLVTLFAIEGVTYDGGEGNLCVNCHQPRRAFPVAENGVITGISEHWGPHHGPQSSMLLGVGGSIEGSPSAHYLMVEDTCVGCHMGTDRVHTYEPSVSTCQACHADAEDFDINGTQTEVEAKLEELKEALVAKGMLTEEDESVVGEYPEAVGAALWNYIFIAHEDKSMGVHNPSYTKALLEASIEALK